MKTEGDVVVKDPERSAIAAPGRSSSPGPKQRDDHPARGRGRRRSIAPRVLELAGRAAGLANQAGALRLALRGMEGLLENGDELRHTEVAAALTLAEGLEKNLWVLEDAIMCPWAPLE